MFAISVFDRSTYVDTPVGSRNEDFCSQLGIIANAKRLLSPFSIARRMLIRLSNLRTKISAHNTTT